MTPSEPMQSGPDLWNLYETLRSSMVGVMKPLRLQVGGPRDGFLIQNRS